MNTPGRTIRGRSPVRERGVALMLVLVAIALAMVLSAAFLGAQSTTTVIADNTIHQAQARALADSALAMAIHQIRAEPTTWRTSHNWPVWVDHASFQGGTITITAQDGVDANGDGIVEGDGSIPDDLADPVTLTALATVQGVTHQVRAVVNVTESSGPGQLLMVVPDPSHLSTQDANRQRMCESFGWTVTLFDQDSSAAQFVEAAQNHVVAYISSSVTTDNVGTRLAGQAIGIVSEKPTLVNELGLAGQQGSTGLSLLSAITDDSHYITENFEENQWISLTGSFQTTVTYRSVQADSAKTLVTSLIPLYPNLVVIPSGGLLYNNATAPGRRVFMPWGDTSFDPNALTAQGKTLLERALDWAGQTGGAANTGIAVKTSITLTGGAIVDSYDSGLGAYGGANISSLASLTTNATGNNDFTVHNGAQLKGSGWVGPGSDLTKIFKVNAGGLIFGERKVLDAPVEITAQHLPNNLPTSIGDQTISGGDYTYPGGQPIRVNRLTISGNSRVQITGPTTIVCDGVFTMKDAAQMQVMPGGSLTIYARASMLFQNAAKLNINTGDPSLVKIIGVGCTSIRIIDAAQVCARVEAAEAQLRVEAGQFLGSFLGNSLAVDLGGKIHQDINVRGGSGSGSGGSGDGSGNYAYSVSWSE